MTNSAKHNDYLHAGRKDYRLPELDHDPYHSKRKIREPTVCPKCGALFHKGRWSRAVAPAHAHTAMCPACHRIQDKVPAGLLTLRGEFFLQHKDEILHLIRNTEEKEKAEHPLKRIMDIQDQGDETVISFTDAHLTRGTGQAIQHAYKGELELHYAREEVMVRATWSR